VQTQELLIVVAVDFEQIKLIDCVPSVCEVPGHAASKRQLLVHNVAFIVGHQLEQIE